MTHKPILMATDLGCRCDRALDRATALAVERQTKMVVLHVLEEPWKAPKGPSWRHRGVQEAAIDRVLRDLRGAEGLEVEVIVERGEPATVILEVSRRHGCGIIVTGVARDETLGRIWLGATVTALARKADVPVLVVKSRPRGSYRNVIVATDFSDGSRHALEMTLALFPKAQVRLFHSISTLFGSLGADDEAGRELTRRQAMIEASEFLDTTPAVTASGLTVQALCEHGEIAGTLQELVESQGCDLVVVGTQGRSGLAGLLLGSVAHYLLTSLAVDVLVVPQRKSEWAAQRTCRADLE